MEEKRCAWCRGRESNPRPNDYESFALTPELPRRSQSPDNSTMLLHKRQGEILLCWHQHRIDSRLT